jgi:hypothetical protein
MQWPSGFAQPGLKFNEHIEADGTDRIRPRLQNGPRRHRVETEGLAVPLGPLAGKSPACEAVRREEEEDWGK